MIILLHAHHFQNVSLQLTGFEEFQCSSYLTEIDRFQVQCIFASQERDSDSTLPEDSWPDQSSIPERKKEFNQLLSISILTLHYESISVLFRIISVRLPALDYLASYIQAYHHSLPVTIFSHILSRLPFWGCNLLHINNSIRFIYYCA
jgi:hypothetical protein